MYMLELIDHFLGGLTEKTTLYVLTRRKKFAPFTNGIYGDKDPRKIF